MVIDGAKVRPHRLESAGFTFNYPCLNPALKEALQIKFIAHLNRELPCERFYIQDWIDQNQQSVFAFFSDAKKIRRTSYSNSLPIGHGVRQTGRSKHLCVSKTGDCRSVRESVDSPPSPGQCSRMSCAAANPRKTRFPLLGGGKGLGLPFVYLLPKLQTIQIFIMSPLGKQLLVGSHFDDFPFGQDDNFMCMPNGRKPMRDNKGRSPRHQTV